MVRNLSCPAVSQIWSFTTWLSMGTVLILKSIPIVVIKVGLKESFAYRSNKHVFPTPESVAGETGRQSMRCAQL